MRSLWSIKFSTIKTDISFLQSPPKEYTDGTVPQVFHFTSCGSTRNRNEIRQSTRSSSRKEVNHPVKRTPKNGNRELGNTILNHQNNSVNIIWSVVPFSGNRSSF